MQIVIASNNQGKLTEIEELVQDLPMQFVPQSKFNVDSPEETGLSFVENAIIKARHCARQTDLPAFADDSGLAVEVLGGAPGIISARYAGENATSEDNIDKLLNSIADVKEEDRKAKFYCAIAFVRHCNDPIPLICQASWEGRILTEKHGVSGFGYDPIFYIPSLSCSAADLEPSQKNKISHRAKALAEFIDKLKILYTNHNT